MATLKDIYDLYTDIVQCTKLFGVTAESMVEFNGLVKAARDAVMKEQGIDDPNKAAALPKDTILGEQAESALKGLQALWR